MDFGDLGDIVEGILVAAGVVSLVSPYLHF